MVGDNNHSFIREKLDDLIDKRMTHEFRAGFHKISVKFIKDQANRKKLNVIRPACEKDSLDSDTDLKENNFYQFLKAAEYAEPLNFQDTYNCAVNFSTRGISSYVSGNLKEASKFLKLAGWMYKEATEKKDCPINDKEYFNGLAHRILSGTIKKVNKVKDDFEVYFE